MPAIGVERTAPLRRISVLLEPSLSNILEQAPVDAVRGARDDCSSRSHHGDHDRGRPDGSRRGVARGPRSRRTRGEARNPQRLDRGFALEREFLGSALARGEGGEAGERPHRPVVTISFHHFYFLLISKDDARSTHHVFGFEKDTERKSFNSIARMARDLPSELHEHQQ